jgi:hypothetical protein
MGWRREIRDQIAELEQQRLRLEERRRARRLGGPEGERWRRRSGPNCRRSATTSTTSGLPWSSSARERAAGEDGENSGPS